MLVLSLIVASSSWALADTPGKDWLTADQVTQKLIEQGFSKVIKMEADDGHWEGDAVKGGKTYEVHVDPYSGALTKSEPKH
jgi:hypothetical protein